MAAARRQMAEEGAASLNMRTVARYVGMTPPALYRYFARRDDLITALIVEAYDELAGAIEAAVATLPQADYAGRLYRGILAYREWAVAHPTEFALIYGSPIPGYDAPEDSTGPAAARQGAAFVRIMGEAWHAGALTLPILPADVQATLDMQMTPWKREHDYNLPGVLIYMVLSTWSVMHGMVSLEVFGHAGAILPDPGVFYRLEVAAQLARIGLHIAPLAYDAAMDEPERRPAVPE